MATIVVSPATPPPNSRSNSATKANSNATARPSTVSHAGSSDLGVVPRSFPSDPHVPLDHLNEKAVANGSEFLTDTGILDAVQEDFRHAVDVAASYLPGSVVGAVGPVLPVGTTNGEETSKGLESDHFSSPEVGQSSKKVDYKDVAIGGIASDFNPFPIKQTAPVEDALDTPAATPTPVPRGRSMDLRKKAIEATAVGAGVGTLGGVAYHHSQFRTAGAETQREPEYANAKAVRQASASPDMQTQAENVNQGKEITGAAALGGGTGAIGDAVLDHSRAHQLPTPPSSPSVTPTSRAGAQGADENPAFVSYAPGPVITEDTPFPDEEDEEESTKKEKGLPPVPANAASVTETSPIHGDTGINGTSSSNGKDADDDKSNKAVTIGLGAGAVGAGGAVALARSRAEENDTSPVASSEAPPQVPPKATSRPSALGWVGTPTPSTSNDKGKGKDVTSGDSVEGAAVGVGAGGLGVAAAYADQQATPAVPSKVTSSSGVLEPTPTPTRGVTGPDPQNKAIAGFAGSTGTSGSSSIEKDLEKEQQGAVKEAEKREKDAKRLQKEAAAAEKKLVKEAKAREKDEKRHEKKMKKEEKWLSKERKEFKKEQAKEEKKEDETEVTGDKDAAGAALGGVGVGIDASVASKQLQKEEKPEKENHSPEQNGNSKQDDAAQQFYLPSERRSIDASISAASPEHPSVTSASDANKRNKEAAAGAATGGVGAGTGFSIAGDKFDSGETKKVDLDQESQQKQLGIDSNSLAIPGNVHPSFKAASPHPVRPGAVALGAAAPNQRPSSGADSDFPLPSVNASTEDVPQAVAISGKGRTSFDSGAVRQDQEQLSTPVARTQSDRARYHGTEGLQEKYSGGALRSSFIEKKTDEEETNVGRRRTQSQGASNRKKEGFVRHLVEKVKGKLHHHEK